MLQNGDEAARNLDTKMVRRHGEVTGVFHVTI
jgi:hypothetical protein